VGRSLEAHIAAVDEEIRALLTGADPSLQPFYGMMLYHLGLEAERGPSGKRLRPVLCTLVYEALTGDARGALPAAAAIDQELDPYDPARVHGYPLMLASVEMLLARLAGMTEAGRREVVGLDPERAPTIVAGMILLSEALRAFELEQIEVSEHDILHGGALRLAGIG